MVKSFSKTVKNSKRIEVLPKEMIVSKDEWDEYYNHFTIRVNNLSEYLNVVERVAIITTGVADFADRLVFRGHSIASSKYKLLPSLGRGNYLYDSKENNLVTEMLTLRPEEFISVGSNFDLLAKLQHYGLPTRLLDFTYNPFIALYFACADSDKSNGRVVCTYDTSTSFTSDVIETVCGMYKYVDITGAHLDEILGDVSQLRSYAGQTMEPLMARPKYSNDRIKHQAAVFMIFPNDICDYRSRMAVLGKKYGNEDEWRRFAMTKEEEERMKLVRKEPNFYDDNFRVDSASMKKLFNYYKGVYKDFYIGPDLEINPKYNYIFKGRFSVCNRIQELSKETLSNSFISILIDAKAKKGIIKELELVGIDKAFVFPELEYTAEKVKNMYT